MVSSKKKGIDLKILILFFVILFWAFLAGAILLLFNSLVQHIDFSRDEPEELITNYIKLTCEDLRIRFVDGGVCYNPSTREAEVSLISIGQANLSTAMINLIGTDSMVMFDDVVNLEPGKSSIIRINYDVDDNGFITIVEVVPRFIFESEKQHCESSKLLLRDILTCP